MSLNRREGLCESDLVSSSKVGESVLLLENTEDSVVGFNEVYLLTRYHLLCTSIMNCI